MDNLMLDLAKHIVDSKKAEWKPERFEDQYEDALMLLSTTRSARRQRLQLHRSGLRAVHFENPRNRRRL
jgi:non-homologous end joining protein Ku